LAAEAVFAISAIVKNFDFAILLSTFIQVVLFRTAKI